MGDAGGRNAAIVPSEKRRAEFLLQQTDLPAERRLGDAQPQRRLPQAADLADHEKSLELAKIHAYLSAHAGIAPAAAMARRAGAR